MAGVWWRHWHAVCCVRAVQNDVPCVAGVLRAGVSAVMPCVHPPMQVIEEQHTFLDRQVSLLRCSLEPLNDDDKVRGRGLTQ